MYSAVKKTCGWKPKNPEFMTALLLYTQADANQSADCHDVSSAHVPTIVYKVFHVVNFKKSFTEQR